MFLEKQMPYKADFFFFALATTVSVLTIFSASTLRSFRIYISTGIVLVLCGIIAHVEENEKDVFVVLGTRKKSCPLHLNIKEKENETWKY